MNHTEEETTTTTSCPVFLERGVCDQGFKCRFLAGHIETPKSETSELPDSSVKAAQALRVDLEKQAAARVSTIEQNIMPTVIIKSIRSRKVRCALCHRPSLYRPSSDELHPPCWRSPKYPTPKTDAYLRGRAALETQAEIKDEDAAPDAGGPATGMLHAPAKVPELLDTLASQHDNPDSPARFQEKKRLHWKGLNCA